MITKPITQSDVDNAKEKYEIYRALISNIPRSKDINYALMFEAISCIIHNEALRELEKEWTDLAGQFQFEQELAEF